MNVYCCVVVLEKHQKAAALESARRAAQVSSPEGPLVSSFASTTASDPSDAEKKVRRKKKKKRRQTDSGRASAAPSMDNANGSQRRQGSVNRSASSVESPEGVQVARVSQTRRANSAYNLEHSPPPRGPSRASAPGDSHEEPIRREEAHLHNQSFPETAVRSGPQLDVPQYSSSPAHQKAFSTTNVSVERRGSQRQQLSASQSHHGKLAAAPGGQGMTKSVSHHGHLSTRPRPGGGGHPVEAYGMGWLTTRRQLSQAEVEFIRRSQIFTMMQGEVPAIKTRRWHGVGLMLSRRRRRWANSKPTPCQLHMFTGMLYSFPAKRKIIFTLTLNSFITMNACLNSLF